MIDGNHSKEEQYEIATLAGGCFWCLEAVFREVRGVVKVVSGYTGGRVAAPSYEAVCSGLTGHAEAVQVTYDRGEITYKQILRIFFATHDPTTLNRQGPDSGTQYRSAIFYHNEAQQLAAEALIRDLGAARIWDQPIVTELKPLDNFYPAENYHQEYFARHPDQLYCRAVISPKLSKFRKEYVDKLKR
jgi:peptide-methionine (S)-S-oxide reductase